MHLAYCIQHREEYCTCVLVRKSLYIVVGWPWQAAGAHSAALNSLTSTRQEENVRPKKPAGQATDRETTCSYLHRQNRLRDNSLYLLLIKLDWDGEKKRQNQNHFLPTFPRLHFCPSLPASQVPTKCHSGMGNRGCVHSGRATLGHSILLTLFPCSSVHPSMHCGHSKITLP